MRRGEVDASATSVLASKQAAAAQEREMSGEVRGNGEGNALPPPGGSPQMFVNVQYVKDFSFENPRAPQSLIQPAAQPDVAINVNAKAQGEPVFLVELAYAAVVTVQNAPEPMVAGMVLVETPRMIFPFARA